MAAPYSPLQEQRDAVPISSFITSNSPHGALSTMNVYIRTDELDQYVKIVQPVVHKLQEIPECECCEISVNPQDKGHIRTIHSWTRDSAWFRENVESQAWFGDYIDALAQLRDPKRPRIIEHFDRLPID